MEVFVAKQPIFTANNEIMAYELLYRDNQINRFPGINGDRATAEVIINSFLNIGIDELSNGKPCFINFTEKLLKLRLPTYFRPREIVVEILESIEPSKEILSICKELKSMGYQIALDDFILNEGNSFSYELLEQADIIKIDFRLTPKNMREKIEEIGKGLNKKLLAEKIETREEFEMAKELGYDYFQGYFFAKPHIVSTNDIPAYFHSYYEIITELTVDEPDIDKITRLIEQDLSLSYKLLKLINSPAYRPKNKINSIRQAIVLLGLIEIQKWIYVLAVRDKKICNNEMAQEMISICLTRAKVCEYIATQTKSSVFTSSPAYFMTGLFSMMDALLNLPMSNVLATLPLQEEICDALQGKKNNFREALDLSIAIEKGQWENVSALCITLGLQESEVFHFYHHAANWAANLMRSDTSVL